MIARLVLTSWIGVKDASGAAALVRLLIPPGRHEEVSLGDEFTLAGFPLCAAEVAELGGAAAPTS